jgi:hypothetical protein
LVQLPKGKPFQPIQLGELGVLAVNPSEFLVVMTVASVTQHQRKLTRLTAARESWQRATKVLEDALAAGRKDS